MLSIHRYVYNTTHVMRLRTSTRLTCEKIQQSKLVRVLFLTSFWALSTCANAAMLLPLSVPLQRRYIHTAVLVVERKGSEMQGAQQQSRMTATNSNWPFNSNRAHSFICIFLTIRLEIIKNIQNG